MTTTVDVLPGDELISLPEALEEQAEQCHALGSPLSAAVLLAVRQLCRDADLRTAELLGELALVRTRDLMGLRILAAAHRLVLTKRAPALAAFYPTAGGHIAADDAHGDALREAVADALAAHPQVVREVVARIPQTNETGRGLPLRGALGRVATAHGLPIRLHELAASAGLNLRTDVMPWAQVPMAPAIRIAERMGCDLHPLDANNPEDRLTLATYVWGDDLDRFERLRSAFVLAQRIPATVQQMAAGAYMTALAHAEPVLDQSLAIWHSATWIYLDRATRAEIRSGIRRLGSRAAPNHPVVHLSWESLREPTDPSRSFALVGRSWPAAGAWAPWRAGTAVMLGVGPAHGMPVRWSEPRPLSSDPLET